MRLKLCVALGGVATLIPAMPAWSAFHGLMTVPTYGAPGGQVTWQVFATFTDPDDYLVSVTGSPTGGPMTIQTAGPGGVGPGGTFFNPISSHGSAPTPYQVNGGFDANTNVIPPIFFAAYDSFYTIGVRAGQNGTGPFGSDETASSNMPPNFISGGSFTSNNAGWFTFGPKEQGRAGWLGDGDASLRVLLLQLTVSPLAMVRGTLNIEGLTNSSLAGAQPFTANGLTFASYAVPGPGSLTILMLAPLLSARRRRN